MAEPTDETDGTPEWAKRMFGKLRMARWYLLLFMFFVAVPVYAAYQLFEAAILGQIWNEKSDQWISFSSDPGRFLLKIAAWTVAVAAPILFPIARAKYPEWTQRFIDNMRLR
jgi:hypothetical protein